MTCAKQRVLAVIIKDDKFFVGENSCEKPQEVCPREGMISGEGYELCKNVCGQRRHAEIDALENMISAGFYLEDSTLYLIGHTYLCDDCQRKTEAFGVTSTVILSDGHAENFIKEIERLEGAKRNLCLGLTELAVTNA